MTLLHRHSLRSLVTERVTGPLLFQLSFGGSGGWGYKEVEGPSARLVLTCVDIASVTVDVVRYR